MGKKAKAKKFLQKYEDLPDLTDVSDQDLMEQLAHVIHTGKDKDKIKDAFIKTIKYKGDLRRAMREVGYAPSTQRNPGRVTNSKAWNALIDYYFPPRELMKKEKELFNHKDWRAVANSLDRIHKIRGSFIKKVDVNVHHVEEFRQMKDDQLREIADADFEVIPRSETHEAGTDGGAEHGSESESGISEEGTSQAPAN